MSTFTNKVETTLNKTAVEVLLPNAEQAAEALTGQHGDEAKAIALRYLTSGLLAQDRNHHKAGRPLPTSWREVVEADAAAKAAKGGGGEGLAVLREATAAFKAWLEQKGVPAKGVAMATKLFGSVAALETCRDDLREKVQGLALEFASTLDDASLQKYSAHLEKVAEAGSEDELALLDF